jgi:hypothetical protein
MMQVFSNFELNRRWSCHSIPRYSGNVIRLSWRLEPGSENPILDLRKISSAVSAVLRGEKFLCSDAVGAERCGYGDLQ